MEALHAALDAVRKQRGISSRQLAKEIGVSPSLLSRLANGYRPDGDSFVTLVSFLNLPAENFVSPPGDKVAPTEFELSAQLAPLLRAHKDLDPEDVDYLQEIIQATVRRTLAARERR